MQNFAKQLKILVSIYLLLSQSAFLPGSRHHKPLANQLIQGVTEICTDFTGVWSGDCVSDYNDGEPTEHVTLKIYSEENCKEFMIDNIIYSIDGSNVSTEAGNENTANVIFTFWNQQKTDLHMFETFRAHSFWSEEGSGGSRREGIGLSGSEISRTFKLVDGKLKIISVFNFPSTNFKDLQISRWKIENHKCVRS